MNSFVATYNHLKAFLALAILILFHKDFRKKDDDGYER